jgi:ankyrin repeat protein
MTPAQQQSLNESFQTAVQKNNLTAVKDYLAQGADVNLKDSFGKTALHRAAYKNYQDIMTVLLDAGADINAQDNRGATPLMDAVWAKSEDAAKILVAAGANVNLKNAIGATALHFAACHVRLPGELETGNHLLHLLVDAGANVAAETNNGQTAMDIAAGEGANFAAAPMQGKTAEDITTVYALMEDAAKYLGVAVQEQDKRFFGAFRNGLDYPVKAPRPWRFKP